MSDLKLYRAKLHTGGKTDEQIKAQFSPSVPTQAEMDLARATYEAWDGLECLVMKNAFGEAEYSFCGAATEAGLPQAKEAVYLMEQDAMFGTYIDQREEFDRDYDSFNYFPSGSFVFRSDEVEILEEMKPCAEGDGNG